MAAEDATPVISALIVESSALMRLRMIVPEADNVPDTLQAPQGPRTSAKGSRMEPSTRSLGSPPPMEIRSRLPDRLKCAAVGHISSILADWSHARPDSESRVVTPPP